MGKNIRGRLRAIFSLGFLLGISAWAQSGIAGDLLSPSPGALVFHSRVLVEVQHCADPSGFEIFLISRSGIPAVQNHWRMRPQIAAWNDRAWTWVDLPAQLSSGSYNLSVNYRCAGQAKSQATWFSPVASSARLAKYADLGFGIIKNYLAQRSVSSAAALDWDWQDAVFLFGSVRFLEALEYLRREEGVAFRHPQEDAFLSSLRSYYKVWSRRGVPSVNRADPCAPALPGALLYGQARDPEMRPALEAVARYLREAPRMPLGTLPHLGWNTFFSFFYPTSIWVDSLVMYGLVASVWGFIENDNQLNRFGLTQPLIFARVLQDPVQGLFKHAWIPEVGQYMPMDQTFWLRGNGWAATSLIENLSMQLRSGALGVREQRELEERYTRLITAALRWLSPRGLWTTVMNTPEQTYPEVSGSALFANAMLKGIRLGYLQQAVSEQGALVKAKSVSDSIIQRLQMRPIASIDGWSVPEISGPTDAAYEGYEYRNIGITSDKGYGVGAVLLMLGELARSG